MEVHKSHWINILADENDETHVKRRFIKNLGFSSAADALAYLQRAEQTTFVGGWFLTDEELEAEKEARDSDETSVYSVPYPSEDGRIIVLKNEVGDQLDEPEFRALGKMLADMGDSTPDNLDVALRRLKKIIAWAAEESDTFEESIRQLICETILELTKTHANNRRVTIVLIELMGAFIQQQETKDAPAPFYVRTIGEA